MGTLETLLIEITNRFTPLIDRIEKGQVVSLLDELGLAISGSSGSYTEFTNAFVQLKANIEAVFSAVSTLNNAIEQDNIGNIIFSSNEIIGSLKGFLKGIESVSDSIKSEIGAGTIGISEEELDDFLMKLPKKLFDFLFITTLEEISAPTANVLEFLKIIDREEVVQNGNTISPSLIDRTVHFSEIPNFISNPSKHFKNHYDWNKPGFDGTKLFKALSKILLGVGIPVIYDEINNPSVLNALFFEILVDNSKVNPGLLFRPGAGLKAPPSFSIEQEGWKFLVNLDIQLKAGAQLSIFPDGTLKVVTPQFAGGSLFASWEGGYIDRPFEILAIPGGSTFEANQVKTSLEVLINETGSGSLEWKAELNKIHLLLDLSSGDDFINKISANKIESEIDLKFGYSTKTGFFIEGSGGLEINLPLHLEIGPIELKGLTITVPFQNEIIPLTIGANIKASLGPLFVSIDDIGFDATFSFPNDNLGNLGPIDLNLGFNPPNGIGLSLNTGVIKGGGYLYFNSDREEYAGALELVFSGWITLKAIGLITTKLPDGSKGYSLIVVITVEFGSGIQLGLGFTLLGVGGLLGFNRTAKLESLKEGVRTGAVESVMFPQNMVENAPRIISDLRRFFPPAKDLFLIGPMAKIGYGTPTYLSVTLGVIIEEPSVNISILGVLKVVIPEEENAILRFQVNFIGRIEPSNQLMWFYAQLFDSRVLFFMLEGGMGLLLNWGDNTNFVVSLGGFHPKFDPPPLPFPAPPRIPLLILNKPQAKVRIEGYFAVSSNALMFGANAEIFFGLSDFKIEGHLSFDTLIQTNPCFFSIGLSYSLSVKVFGVGLFSVGFNGLLEGPTPWYIEGKGEISLLFFSISVPFDHTWGESRNSALAPIEVFPIIEKEFKVLTNWQAVLPSSNNILVSLRKFGNDEDSQKLVLHPVGKLQISQRKIPINFKFDKVGNQRPSDINKILVNASISGNKLTISETEEKFAIGQFKDLDDSKKLSSPAFQLLDGGIEVAVAGEQLKTSKAVKRVIRYETSIIDNNYKRYPRSSYKYLEKGFVLLHTILFGHFLKGCAVAKSTLSNQHKKRMAPFDELVHVQENQYSVAFNTNNKPYDNAAVSFSSQIKAQEYMEQQIQAEPNLVNNLHVIPNTEINLTV